MKLEFVKFKKVVRSLIISQSVVDPYIFCQIVALGPKIVFVVVVVVVVCVYIYISKS